MLMIDIVQKTNIMQTMQLEKILKPLGKDAQVLKSILKEDALKEWLLRPRSTLGGNSPYELLNNSTPTKIIQIKKVIQCLKLIT